MSATLLPHGAWPSPIRAETVAAGAVRLAQVEIVDGDLLWIEGRSTEQGRCVVVRRRADGGVTELPPPFNARTRVHEYGGGSFLARGDTVWFSHFDDQRLYRREGIGVPVAITPEPADKGTLRYADGRLTPDGRFVLCVHESHVRDDEPVNTVVAVPSDGSGEPRVLAVGRTFYSSPRPSPDSTKLAWICWDHPRMPWDGTELWTADLSPDGEIADPRLVAGGPEESIFQPEWSPDGRLHFASDRSGWWNLYEERDGGSLPLCPMEAEWGGPAWIFGLASYAFLEEGRIACVVTERGRERLGILEPGAASPSWLDLPYTSYQGSLRSDGRRLAFLAGSSTEAQAVVSCGPDGDDLQVHRRSLQADVDPSWLPPAEPIAFPSAGRTAYGIHYPPTNPDCEAPEGERPPLIVLSHGGPTSNFPWLLDLATAFWTSRGFGVVKVDYGGSTGYGRAYRKRLDGQWGIVDVEDCAAAATFLAERGDADPGRLIIRGGSAGGYTTLAALAFRDVFAAGASYYGVADAEALARDTHKFESRYMDGLIGPYPEARETYRKRSPIHAADRLSCPVIFFQGLEDRVVPPAQTRVMYEALVEKGVPTACLEFEGEQHGFRLAETTIRALTAELAFYGRVLGFDPAGDPELPEIANLTP